mmetsp:Transcript_37060/g.73357  ORF Transcript_37060/g.73357 Transcript_37060/m.73357 type:complete len:244 (+) Transcript_37060:21-752(+)
MSNPKALALGAAAAGTLVGAVLCRWLQRRSKAGTMVETAIRERRSMFLQDLNGDSVPDESVARMLEVANWAPTHGQTQPWRFVVFRRSTGQVAEFFKLQLGSSEARMKQEGLPADERAALSKFITKQPKKNKEIAKCSHIVAVSMKRQANPEKLMPEWEEVAAVSSAVQNAHLLACQLGVAMYWTSGGTEGPLNTAEVRRFLKLDEGDKCLGLMCIGMADQSAWEKSQKRAQRTPISDKTLWR